MISDVLFDAIDEIDYYLENFPEIYENEREELVNLRRRMHEMRIKLDAYNDLEDANAEQDSLFFVNVSLPAPESMADQEDH